MPDLSIIIVSYKGWERLTRCLESLNSFDGNDISLEVIVVDNLSEDEEIFNIEARFDQFRFIHNTCNGGFANGCNLGALNAQGEYLLFLNPDTLASESEVVKLLFTARQNQDFTILSCRQINEKGKVNTVYGNFPEFCNLTGFQRSVRKAVLHEKITEADSAGMDIIFPDWVSGSVIMIRKESFMKLNGFDEDFWMYYEDVDLCKRVSDKGGRVAFCSNIIIEHNHGGSSRINPETTSLTKAEVNISRHVYINKHKKGAVRVLIQIFLVTNNIISCGLLALAGVILFFVPKIFVRGWIFIRLVSYYCGSILRQTWISPRSAACRKIQLA